MTALLATSVSKRLYRPVVVLLWLAAMQGLISLSGCHEEPLPMGAYRVSAGR